MRNKKDAKRVENFSRQGDVMFVRLGSKYTDFKDIPKDFKLSSKGADAVVAHSETGHHHVASGVDLYTNPNNPFLAFMHSEKDILVKHHREFDTHEAHLLRKGAWQVVRQRRQLPNGAWGLSID